MVQNGLPYDKAFNLITKVLDTYDFLRVKKKEFLLSRQLLRSGASIETNLAEAKDANPEDFSDKINTAYKGCLETRYWLSLLKETDNIDEQTYRSLLNDVSELSRMLFPILRAISTNNLN